MKSAAIYLRVSTAKKRGFVTPLGASENRYLQNTEVQVEPLKKLCDARGWKIAGVYIDRLSGYSNRRPEYQKLLEDARRGLFTVVLVWRFDRFARSVKELVTGLEEFRSLGIDFVSHQEAIDTSTPMGKMVFTITAAFAEMEGEIIRERINAGLDHARAHGTKSGLAIGRPKVVFRRDEAVKLRSEGLSFREISRRLGIGLGTVLRACTQTRPSDSV